MKIRKTPVGKKKKLKIQASLSLKESRQIILSAQGLAGMNAFGKGPEGARRTISHLGYVQIDTISVVERAHNHVIWSRVKDFNPEVLSKLVQERKIFEYWSHAAAFLPIEAYRYSLPRKKLFASGEILWFQPTPENLRLKKQVLRRIKSEGGLSARDFTSEADTKSTGWWDWKPAKRALEQLFLEGHLMISSRPGFQKVYDLTERVLPENIDATLPSPAEHARYLILSAARAHGLVRIEEIAYMRSSLKEQIKKQAEVMLNEGILELLSVDKIETPFLAIRNEWELAFKNGLNAGVQILSPFDNQIIQRKRLKELFSFDYTIECYVPEPKRKYGYFSLPLIEGDTFIGRIDAKAMRSDKVLNVKSLHLEPGQGRKTETWRKAQPALDEFAQFNACTEVTKGFR